MRSSSDLDLIGSRNAAWASCSDLAYSLAAMAFRCGSFELPCIVIRDTALVAWSTKGSAAEDCKQYICFRRSIMAPPFKASACSKKKDAAIFLTSGSRRLMGTRPIAGAKSRSHSPVARELSMMGRSCASRSSSEVAGVLVLDQHACCISGSGSA